MGREAVVMAGGCHYCGSVNSPVCEHNYCSDCGCSRNCWAAFSSPAEKCPGSSKPIKFDDSGRKGEPEGD